MDENTFQYEGKCYRAQSVSNDAGCTGCACYGSLLCNIFPPCCAGVPGDAEFIIWILDETQD